ncbi:porin family protein [Fulvivirga sp.]|uniref:porin family protein n=1 Tax=Fulvivirga sp. TaxID=1931237 RepID=UPI0032EC1161
MMKNLIATLILSTVSLSVMAEGVPQLKAERGPMKIRKRQARPDVPGHLLIEFGLNLLLNDDPAIETEILGSRTLNFYYLYDFRIGNSKFYFLPGVGVGLDRYKFEEDVTLTRAIDSVGVKSVAFSNLDSVDVKKSMLVTNYLDIPLELRFYGNPEDQRRSFKVGVGFKVGMLMSSHTKIKKEDDGNRVKEKVKDSFELTRFRYGVTGRIGIGGFNVFYYQNLTPLFEKGKGPNMTEASNITIGLSFTGF